MFGPEESLLCASQRDACVQMANCSFSHSLKMSFVNVGTQSPESANGAPVINHGSAPILASVFSEPFQVFSAKKFPGVIESTQLSKCFALQGIKIPIRKDGVKGPRGRGGDGDDDDGDDF